MKNYKCIGVFCGQISGSYVAFFGPTNGRIILGRGGYSDRIGEDIAGFVEYWNRTYWEKINNFLDYKLP